MREAARATPAGDSLDRLAGEVPDQRQGLRKRSHHKLAFGAGLGLVKKDGLGFRASGLRHDLRDAGVHPDVDPLVHPAFQVEKEAVRGSMHLEHLDAVLCGDLHRLPAILLGEDRPLQVEVGEDRVALGEEHVLLVANQRARALLGLPAGSQPPPKRLREMLPPAFFDGSPRADFHLALQEMSIQNAAGEAVPVQFSAVSLKSHRKAIYLKL